MKDRQVSQSGWGALRGQQGQALPGGGNTPEAAQAQPRARAHHHRPGLVTTAPGGAGPVGHGLCPAPQGPPRG